VSDFTLRLVVVGGVLALVGATVLVLRMRDRAPSRPLGTVPLDPGIYLFTSAACGDCHTARERLERRLGSQGFVEYTWESDPRIFETLSIDKVPCSVTVDDARRATLWIGQPDRMISAVDP
jgi:glutaredoxin-related protein